MLTPVSLTLVFSLNHWNIAELVGKDLLSVVSQLWLLAIAGIVILCFPIWLSSILRADELLIGLNHRANGETIWDNLRRDYGSNVIWG